MKKLPSLCVLGLILSLTHPGRAGEEYFSEDFDNWPQLALPTASGIEAYGWYTDTASSYRISWEWSSSPYLWNRGGPATNATVWRTLSPAFVSPVLQATMWNGSGADMDAGIWSRLWLTDGNGNGYMGEINRSGTLNLYRVSNGTFSLLATLDGAQVPDGNKKIITLGAVGGVVTLSFQYPGDVRWYGVSATDNNYTLFTTLGLGGQYSCGETHGIDDVRLSFNPVAGTALAYSGNFNNWGNGVYLPTVGGASTDYWYSDVAGNYFSWDDYWPSRRLWNSGVTPLARDANCWRSFRTSGELAAGVVLLTPVLQATMANGAGSNDDPSMWSRMWLEDENGNGYMGRINRPGQMEIYRLDNGKFSLLAASDEAQVPNGDAKVMKLAVASGVVTLSFQYPGADQVYALHADDSTYAGFTTIGLGGQYGWGESHTVDDVTVSGVKAADPDETVTVDFAVNGGTATGRASGFLHGFSTTEPQDDLIAPLKITNIRGHLANWSRPGEGSDGLFDTYARARSLGINKIQAVISDSYGYQAPWPGDNNWTDWETVVRDTVTRARSEGKVFYWDIWNEPNGDGQVIFGKPASVGWPQFLEAWKRAVNVIRAISPGEVIVGPSLAGLTPNYQYMGSFLIYARDNNVLPDILSWHDHYDIVTHVNWVRGTMALYGISERPISINEYTDQSGYTNPGYLTKLIAQFEEAKVDCASRTLWDDYYSDDFWLIDHSLDAILMPGTFEKRPAWWVYKGYADIAGSLFKVSSTSSGAYNVPVIYGVAGYDGTANAAKILIGKDEYGNAAGTKVVLTHLSSLPNLSYSGRVRVQASRIANTGWEPLDAPVKTVDTIYPISNDQVTVKIPNLRNKDAYTLDVTLSSLAFADGFESGNFTTGGWSNSGCDLQTSYKWAGSRAVRFNSSDSLTKLFSTQGLQNIQVSYACYTRQCETDDHFIAEWYDGATWYAMENVAGNSAWTVRTFALPAGAANNPSFRLRFRTSHNGSSDYAYVDEVKIVGDPLPAPALVLSGAVSRKTHGGTTYDLPLTLMSLKAKQNIESRLAMSTQVVFTFAGEVGPVSGNNFILTNATYGSASAEGNVVTLNLAGVVNNSWVTIELADIQSTSGQPLTGDHWVQVGVLPGDINQDGYVNSLDQAMVKSQLGAVSASSYRCDLDGNGSVNSLDQAIVKSQLGKSLS